MKRLHKFLLRIYEQATCAVLFSPTRSPTFLKPICQFPHFPQIIPQSLESIPPLPVRASFAYSLIVVTSGCSPAGSRAVSRDDVLVRGA